jgi:hypothetical protein
VDGLKNEELLAACEFSGHNRRISPSRPHVQKWICRSGRSYWAECAPACTNFLTGPDEIGLEIIEVKDGQTCWTGAKDEGPLA